MLKRLYLHGHKRSLTTSECGYIIKCLCPTILLTRVSELDTCKLVSRDAFLCRVLKGVKRAHTAENTHHKLSRGGECKHDSVLLCWGLCSEAPCLFPTSCCLLSPAKPPQHFTAPQPCTHTVWDSTVHTAWLHVLTKDQTKYRFKLVQIIAHITKASALSAYDWA